MTSKVQPIPEGYHTATPYLIVSGAARAIEFYKKAFGATELFRMAQPDGRIGHAEIKIGNSPIMLADEFPEMGARSPQSLGGSAVSILLCRGRGRTVQPGRRCRRESAQAGGGQVLRRPVWRSRGPLRTPMAHCHTQGGHSSRGIAKACCCLGTIVKRPDL